jgi:hypothetical protein
MKLITVLKDFSEMKLEEFTNENLTNRFSNIAKTILYDGYIRVRNDYRVYIKTVEFYFHAENDSPIKVYDPIVYHRNGRLGREVPYFPMLTLHAHMSGFDITFENPSLKYRASALIREYAIYDENAKNFIKTKEEHKKDSNKDKIPYDNRSTFLYDFINGFSLTGGQNDIAWEDEENTISHDLKFPSKPRVNVMKYPSSYIDCWKKNPQEIKEKDERPWNFTRTNDVWPKEIKQYMMYSE